MSPSIDSRRGPTARACLAAGTMLLTAALLATPASAAETLSLDLGNPLNASPAGALRSASALAKGEHYVVTVRGSGSMWPATELTAPSAVCGAPEPAPVTASPGKPSGPAGIDAQTLFGAPAGSKLGVDYTCTTPSLPRNTAGLYTAFELATSAGSWKRPAPVGGPRTRPRTDHTYVYEVTGEGNPAAFRFVDTPSDDNYGVLGISILSAAQCAAISCQGSGSGGFQAGTAGDQRNATSPLLDGAGQPRAIPTCALTLRVRLSASRGAKLKSAKVRAGGKTIATLGRKSVKSAVTLRRLPAKRFTLTVTGMTTAGRKVSVKRSIAGCRTPSSSAKRLPLR